MERWLTSLLTLLIVTAIAQKTSAQTNLWSSPAAGRPSPEKSQLAPGLPALEKGALLDLDLEGMRNLAGSARQESTGTGGSASTVLLPLPDGSFQKFKLWESPLMAPGLAAKFPEIKTYIIKGVDDPFATGRLDVSPWGFGAFFASLPNGREVHIRKVLKDDPTRYLSFWSKDDPARALPLECSHQSSPGAGPSTREGQNRSAGPNDTGDELRIFRLAMTVTGATAEAQGWTSTGQALAAVVSFLGEINVVYERDLAVRFILPEGEDKLLFLDDDTDPFTAYGGGESANENVLITHDLIGVGAYDVGLVFVTGGCCAAQLPVICNDDNKAYNFSRFNNLYVTCHEIGHQFGANHTWTSCGPSNNGQFGTNEYGSGTSIMSYQGLCGVDDILPAFSGTFFGVYSQLEMTNVINARSCYKTLPSGNSIPEITLPAGGFYIPISTPFELVGSATDADGDALSYSWEQTNVRNIDFTATNISIQTPPTAADGNVPITRIFEPKASPRRAIPQWQDILTGNSTVFERLPTYNRNLKFSLNVRDNHPGAGGTAQKELSFEVDETAGPFQVAYPYACETWTAGSTQSVFWNVANTDNALVNCQNVNVLLSLDGGLTWPITLAANTPNDGDATITVPTGINTNHARVRVEAVGNIFFDVTDSDLVITETGAASANQNRMLELDGADDEVLVQNTSLANFGSVDFTVETWLKTTKTEPQAIISKRSVCGCSNFWNLLVYGNKLVAEFSQAGCGNYVWFESTSAVNDGNWHHVAITAQGMNFKMYVDGVLETSGSITTLINNNDPFVIGSNACNAYFRGSLDELRVWNIARTAAEISSAQNCPLTGTESGLVAYYPFDEVGQNVCSPGIFKVSDKTGNPANDGFLHDGAHTTLSSMAFSGCAACAGNTISISVDPAPSSAPPGSTATFSVAASGGANLAFQWQLSKDFGATWADIPGATADTYSFTVADGQNFQLFRCRLNNGCDIENSEPALLQYGCATPTLSALSGNATPCQNNPITYFVEPNPDIVTWQWTLPAGWTYADFGNMILATPSGTSGTVSVKGTNECGQHSALKTLAVSPVLVEISAQPVSQSKNEGQSASFSVAVSAGGGTTVYQWQQSTDGGETFSDLAGETNSTLTIASVALADDDKKLRCIVKNDCLSDTSAVADLTVNCTSSAPETPGEILGSNFVCTGSVLAYSVGPVPGATSYVWTLPGGWTGTSTTNSITATAPASGASGTLKVAAANACGTSGQAEISISENSGPCKNALHFDGADDYLTIPQNGLAVQAAATIEFWVKPERLSGRQTLVFNGEEFIVGLNGDAIFYKHSDDCCGYDNTVSFTFGLARLLPNVWQHVAIRRLTASRLVQVFVNGVLKQSANYGNAFAQPGDNVSYPLTLGAGATGAFQNFRGALDGVRVWNTARSNAQILQGLVCVPGAGTGNLLASFDFEQGQPFGNNVGLSSFSNTVAFYPAATPHNFALVGTSSNVVSQAANHLFLDSDGDGFGSTAWVCGSPGSPVFNDDDCDDAQANTNPNALEICDGSDNNCDGTVDNPGLGLLFSEDFDNVPGNNSGGNGTLAFPAGWTLVNVDGKTPVTELNFLDGAWERFAAAPDDTVAAAASWFDPVGVADRWMWSPLVGPLGSATDLAWSAMALDGNFRDGYEVRVMLAADGPPAGSVGNLGNMVSGSTLVLSVAAENATWTNRSVSLAAFAGQSVYIGFRNNSNDKAALAVDDILVLDGALASPETCDGLDNNCNAQIDEGVLNQYFADSDGDGFGNAASPTMACTLPSGHTTNDDDCDDTDSAIHPGAPEFCNTTDDDCDGATDEGPIAQTQTFSNTTVAAISSSGTPTVTSTISVSGLSGNIMSVKVKNLKILHTWVSDLDAKLMAPNGQIFNLFDRPGVPASTVGCDKDNILASFYDAATLTAANFESTCNNSTTSSPPGTYAISGNYQPITPFAPLNGATPNGNWVLTVKDNASSDGGSLQEWSLEFGTPAEATISYADSDGDGFGDAAEVFESFCGLVPSGYVSNDDDCDDNAASINPGATEICNSMDDNCDGQIDDFTLFSEDFDNVPGSTAGGPGTHAFPAGWTLVNVDGQTPVLSEFNDAWERFPDGSNLLDTIAASTSWYAPPAQADDWMWSPLIGGITATTSLSWQAMAADANYPDGYQVRVMLAAAGPPTGSAGNLGNMLSGSTLVFSIAGENPAWTDRSVSLAAFAGQSVYIGFRNYTFDGAALLIDDIIVNTAPEICNGLDDDCDGQIDEGVQNQYFADADGDTYGDPATTQMACSPPSNFVANDDDCDDSNATINPAATEICNSLDDDCDGETDNFLTVTLFSEDFDNVPGSTAGGPGTYAFPAGWTLVNVDNRTPDGQVGYVNDAWERREDFVTNVADSVAISTSWYSPVGQADDWMWTPLIAGISAVSTLSWKALAADPDFRDGYEVRVKTGSSGPPTGGPGNLGNMLSGSTQVFSVAAENSTWTDRSVSLAAFAGQSVYIGFRNNANDKFLLLIDDIAVTSDGTPAEICNNTDDDCDGQIDEGFQPASTSQFFTLDIPKNIQNGNPSTVTSTLTIFGVQPNLLSVKTGNIHINHTWVGDLKATLIAPNGVEIPLFNRPGHPATIDGCEYDNLLVAFDDAAALTAANFENTCNTTSPTISGVFKPITPFSVLEGIDPNGVWTLRVDDIVFGDGGSLEGWSLFINAGYNAADSWPDADLDNYGNDAAMFHSDCGYVPPGNILTGGDCDDDDDAVNPAATEICNLIDDDCDAQIDEGVLNQYFADTDGDGFGDPSISQTACSQPSNFVPNDGDCDDDNPDVNPGESEICNNLDDNCNGQINEHDAAPPTINCPDNQTLGSSGGLCSSTATWTVPVPTDVCGASIQSYSHAPGSAFPVGSTTVTYVAVDGAGSTASCQFSITVADDDPPTAICKNASLMVSPGAPSLLAAALVNDGSADNCTATAGLSLAVSPASFDCADAGVQTVTLTVADAAGQSATCTASLTVFDAPDYAEVARRNPADGLALDKFGWSIALADGIALAGAPEDKIGALTKQGSAHIFLRDLNGPGSWGHLKLVKAGDGAASDFFGRSVALDGDYAFVGAELDNVGANTDQGSAYVFQKDLGGTDNWGQLKQLAATDGEAYEYFGNSMSAGAGRVLVGALSEKNGATANLGAAYLFEKDLGGPNNWGQIKKLTASDRAAAHKFGTDVSISGDCALVGAPGHTSSRGAAYVFKKDNGGPDNWGELKKLAPGDPANGDLFGTSVHLSGDWAIVGAFGKQSQRGYAYIFQKDQGGPDNWGQVAKIGASDGAAGAKFGADVAVAGDYAYVSAPAAAGKGAVYVFHRNAGGPGQWGQIARREAADAAANDNFGQSLAVSGAAMALGSPLDDVGTASDRGSLYVFEGADCGGVPRRGRDLQAGEAQNPAEERGLQLAPGDFALYPNPVSGENLFVNPKNFAGEKARLELRDALGRLLESRDFEALPDGEIAWEVGHLAPGAYFVSLKTDGARALTRRFLVQR